MDIFLSIVDSPAYKLLGVLIFVASITGVMYCYMDAKKEYANSND